MALVARECSWSRIIFLVVAVLILIWSGIDPYDRFTWVLETLPAWVGLVALIYFNKRMTTLLYILIALHCIILCVGGKYTYAEVPFGFWVSEIFGWSRNHYDRLGHFFQGFEPAILAREVLLRKRVVSKGVWLSVFCITLPLAFSAFYELIEWWVALFTGENAEAFLGTQGDVWDTQWDMFLALIGAGVAVLALSRIHSRQLSLNNHITQPVKTSLSE